MAVTLKTISERVGLSQAAVSQILNRKPNDLSSEATRRKVFAIAEELGYKQKFGHKLLRGDKTNTVAILVALHIMSLEEHIQQLIFQLLNLLEKRGFSLYVMTLEGDGAKNLKTIEDLCARGTEKFLFIGDPVGGEKIRAKLAENGKRAVGYGSPCPFEVRAASTPAIKNILSFFLENKRENFKMILPGAGTRMYALYELFPHVSQEELQKRYLVPFSYRRAHDLQEYAETGFQLTREIFEKDPEVSALLFHTDYFAVGGVRYLLESGRIPGKDVLVAGVNNIHAVKTGFFPVSSAYHPLDDIVKLLLEGIENDKTEKHYVPLKDIIRK